MKINVEFSTIQEMQEFGSLFNAKFVPEDAESAIKEVSRKFKADEKKTEKVKEDKHSEKEVEKADVVAVDNSSDEPVKDAEIVEAKVADNGPRITKEMVRDIFSKALKAGKAAEAKALTIKYGAKKVTEIKEEDYPAIYAEAKELIG